MVSGVGELHLGLKEGERYNHPIVIDEETLIFFLNFGRFQFESFDLCKGWLVQHLPF